MNREVLQPMDAPQNIMAMNLMQRQHQQQQQLYSFMNANDDHHHQQQQQHMCIFSAADQATQFQGLINIDHQSVANQLLLNQAMKQEPVIDTAWNDMNYSIPRTISCPPAVAVVKETATPEKITSDVGRESFNKRKADKSQSLKVTKEEETKEKKMKVCESKIIEQHSNNSKGETSGDASKISDVKKPDYIHVRARRGQATDSHSLAERVRREKISERMKFLQDLVPGCNKIVGKAGMLDEIINYVQSLQRQVEFLSMKIAAVNPTMDFNFDNFYPKEIFSGGLSSEVIDTSNLQINSIPQVVLCSGLETSICPDTVLRRTISAPVSATETLLDQSCFNQIQQSSTWDASLQNLYAMEFEEGKCDSILPHPFTGYIETGHVKLEI